MPGIPNVALVLARLLLILSPCTAVGIRSPPPIHDIDDIAASTLLCQGHRDGWQWDRCAIDGVIAWTALAFGHVNMSGQPPPRTMGKHIQYSPFTCEQPYMGSLDRNREMLLPPMVFAVYLQSHAPVSFVWKSSMRLLFYLEDDRIDFEMLLDISRNSFKCDCADSATIRGGLLVLQSNTEYVMDNVLTHLLFEPSWYRAVVESGACDLVNLDVSLEPAAAPEIPTHSRPLSWAAQFAIASDRKSNAHRNKKPIVTPNRGYASLVSHKLCNSMHVSKAFPQRYDPNTKTLSISAQNGPANVSVIVLAASVTHDRQHRAVAEFLVWFEENNACGQVVAHANCMSSPFSFANLSCAVRGASAPADVEVQKFALDGHPRERVISCAFDSSSFASSDEVVDIYLHDPFFAFKALIPMCALTTHRQIRKIDACSQPIYNADFLEARWPGILQSWILYHVKYLGFDHFSLYDVDGSALAYLAPLLNSSFLSYYNRWAPTPCLKNLTASRAFPYCTETLMENQCVWNARGAAEWVMLIHAPDCFLNDSPGMPTLFGLLRSMDHSKSSLMMPTYLFEFPTDMLPMPDRQPSFTAADIFTFFNVRACPILNAFRHLLVVDPHLIHVTRVHEALDGFNLPARLYTASIAVNHYLQLFSSRTARHLAAISSDGMRRHPNGSVDHCLDEQMSHVSEALSFLLKQYAPVDEERSSHHDEML